MAHRLADTFSSSRAEGKGGRVQGDGVQGGGDMPVYIMLEPRTNVAESEESIVQACGFYLHNSDRQHWYRYHEGVVTHIITKTSSPDASVSKPEKHSWILEAVYNDAKPDLILYFEDDAGMPGDTLNRFLICDGLYWKPATRN